MISETPKIKFSYEDNNPMLNGDGAQIPVFIGYTGNETPASGLLKFRGYKMACKSVELGGIGLESEDNFLLATIKDFFTEARKRNMEEITVPYVYVIDLGAAPTVTVDEVTSRKITAGAWLEAFALAKNAYDAQVEVYCGFLQEDGAENIVPILDSAVESQIEDATKGNPRDLYFTVHDATDEQLMDYTDDNKVKYVQYSCLGLCQPDEFGKIVARICTTQSFIEPGYYKFRSIANEKYNVRTSEECDDLQEAGIIFINDEKANSNIVTRINLAVSTSFASSNKPNDALFHSRRNINSLVREVYGTLFKQLKANEASTNITYAQTDVNNIVQRRIREETLMKGSYCTVEEAGNDPYTLKATGYAIPVNSTGIIKFTMYIAEPNVIAKED